MICARYGCIARLAAGCDGSNKAKQFVGCGCTELGDRRAAIDDQQVVRDRL